MIRCSSHAVAAAAVALALTTQAAHAQTLTIGLSSPVTSIDPHYFTATMNHAVSSQIFGALTAFSPDARAQPGLAESWTLEPDGSWLFHLRPGIRFQDGAALEAADIGYSVRRLPKVPNSPAPYTIFTRSIVGVDVVDARTVRIRTNGIDPLIPVEMSWISVLHRRGDAAPGAETYPTTAEFNDGSAAIGTGPYRLRGYVPNDRVELERNDAYWGPKPAWQHVTYRMITNDAARTSALLAGDVDVVDAVPTANVAKLKGEARVRLADAVGLRLVYLGLDQSRPDSTPDVTGADGEKLAANPLRDPRVRRALSLAIDRVALDDRIMEGAARPSAQIVRQGLVGYVPGLDPKYDPRAARELLAQAGFPRGFRIVLHGPNDRYLNDAALIQAIGQMWQRVGVQTKVEPLPFASFVGAVTHQQYSAYLYGGTSATGDASFLLRSLIATADPARGAGPANYGRYSNPQFDALLTQAQGTADTAARETLLQQATRLAMDDAAIIPLHIQATTWAMRRDLAYVPRVDEETHADEVRPAQ